MNEENNDNKNEELEKNENNIKDIENAVKDGASLGKNIATGNAAGVAKDAVKLAMNKTVRKKIIISTILKVLAPIMLFIFLGLALSGVFNAVGDAVQDFLEGLADFFTIDRTDGSITITDEQIEAIIKEIESLGVSVEDLKLLGDYTENATEEEKEAALEKYIRKFYEAQVATETLNYYHKNSTNDKTYGSVYVYRTSENDTDGSNKYKLTYIDYEKMKEKQASGDTSIYDNFSIDDSGNLVVVGKEETTIEDLTKNIKYPKQTMLTLTNINYKSAISQYTTKMNFLLYLTMISQNPEFVSAVVDLIKDNRIEITVMDNKTTKVENKTVTYTQHKKWIEKKIIGSGQTQREEETPKRTESDVTEETRTTIETYSPSVKVTYVKTWFCEQEVKYKKGEPINEEPEHNSIGPNSESEPPGEEGSWKTNIVEVVDRTTEKVLYDELPRENVKIILGESGDAEKYKNGQISEPTFVGLMETKFRIPYSTREEEAGSNLVSGAELLFYLLQKDPNLENMELIMKEAINLYLGYKKYDVELDGSIFEIGDFVTAGGGSSSSLLKEYIRMWENSGNAPTNADGTKYIIQDDGAGNLAVGYGIDIYNGGFADLFIAAGYKIELGAEVDVDFVDALEQQEIDSNISSVKSITSGLNLKEYQIHALVSRAYNCGVSGALSTTRGSPAMNFVNSYKTYWKEEDDQFEEKNSDSNFSHSLYTQYMSKPVTASGQYMLGLERRRKSEWTLFQTGYYDVIGKWYEEGGRIIECAREIHQYMEQNNYTYCVYGTNSYEECSKYGKSHGLNRTFEESKNGYHNTCCATYVKWVLQEAGYLGENERFRWCR